MNSSTTFQPSKLGTREHWDETYEEELVNFNDTGDEGEIWFGVESLDKMVEWTTEHVPPSSNATILEVGSGNGTLLFSLVDAGYDPSRLNGIDYSAGAIKLSRGIANSRGCSAITFAECDFLNDDVPKPSWSPSPSSTQTPQNRGGWDLLLDKGTYDAIALGTPDEQGNSPAVRYPARVARSLKSGGLFLITSCNFTEDELESSFATDSTGLIYHSRVLYPTITFGGKSGSMYSSVAFRKK